MEAPRYTICKGIDAVGILTGNTVNLEILAAKILSVSRIIDTLVNINFSDLYVHEYLAILARIS